ncbi:MAG TPA: LytTR family DNA-binding domain-containing protein [Bacteroidia bacterium]|jgi:two-component system LytT family response regulator|nr:LytTR family DNA-binding domain-containing protein [Bacteroidia bacterium]
MLKVLIVNDEKSCRQGIESLLRKKLSKVKIIASVGSFEKARLVIESQAVDLLFISSMIADQMAFEFLNSLKNIQFKVIITTNNERFAIRAITYSTFDYLILPINETEFERVLERVKEEEIADTKQKLEYVFHSIRPTVESSKIALTTGRNEIEFVALNSIIYCEAEGFYTTFHLENQHEILVSKNLKEYEKLLPNNFIRIHKSYLINKNKIKKIIRSDGGYIVMDNKQMLPIGQKKAYFIKHLIN